jgi:hypothetical protein
MQAYHTWIALLHIVFCLFFLRRLQYNQLNKQDNALIQAHDDNDDGHKK